MGLCYPKFWEPDRGVPNHTFGKAATACRSAFAAPSLLGHCVAIALRPSKVSDGENLDLKEPVSSHPLRSIRSHHDNSHESHTGHESHHVGTDRKNRAIH